MRWAGMAIPTNYATAERGLSSGPPNPRPLPRSGPHRPRMRRGYSGWVMHAGLEPLQTQDAIPREDHFVQLYDASWEDYERLLAIRGEKSVPRITYLQGTLEIMSPSREHEKIRSMLGRLLGPCCIDRGIELTPYGSSTLKNRRKPRVAEP